MQDVTLFEVAHLALGEGVSEHLKRQNRAFIASVGGLTFQKDELRTMTWADFGFRINCEPIRTQLISTWITLPGDVAENYLNEDKVDFKMVSDAVRIWKEAEKLIGSTPTLTTGMWQGLTRCGKPITTWRRRRGKKGSLFRAGVNRTSRGPSYSMRVWLRDREKMRKTRLSRRI
jgi:hypothetical protein